MAAWKDHLRILSAMGVLAVLILSCGFFSSTDDATPTVPIKTSTSPPPPPTVTPPPTRGVTPSTQASSCVPYQVGVILPAVDYAAYPQAILTFLNSGGKPEELAHALEVQRVSKPPYILAAIDLNGDGFTDIAVTLVNPSEAMAFAPPGDLLVYICQGGVYGLVYQRASAELLSAPQIHEAQDLNADGSADLVLGFTTCGAHTCFEELEILSWNGESFDNRLVGESADLPSPLVAVNDSDGDGLFDLLVTGRGFGSVGAGPPRPITRLWSFNPDIGVWEVTGEFPGAAEFRIHVIHDADTASRNGDYATAQLLYQQALENAALQNWEIHDPAELLAYARFKLVLLHMILGNSDAADARYQELVGSYAPSSPQFVFVEMSVLFRNGFFAGGASAGCEEVRIYIVQHSNSVLPLLDYGYGNPEYTPQDICPW